MRRLLLLLLVAALTAVAIWYGLRVAEKSSPVAVTSLLPKDTLLLVHLPDFNRTRAQWHETDLYQIWRQPAVQDFLQKPLSKIPKSQATSQNLAEFERLEPKDAFFAVTSWASADLKLAGGFRFKGSAQDAEKIVEKWRAKLLAKFPEAKHETVEYQQLQIQTVAAAGQTLATVYDGDWLFAANDLAELKAIVDCADGRAKDQAATLAGDATFSAALKHMPGSYATLIYGRLDRYFEKMMPLLAAGGAASNEIPIYRQIHAFCGTLAFDGRKVRDVLFIGMPQLVNAGPLTRRSLLLGTKETFLFLASFLNLPKQMQGPPATPAGAGLPGVMQKIAGAVSSSGITLDEWNAAFGPEFGMLGDWPANSRWPSVFATVPVKDAARASQVLAILTRPAGGATWAEQEKEGVRYFSVQSGANLFSFSPTLALSDKILVAGTDAGAVEAAMKRSANGNSELEASQNFQIAEDAVPTAKQAFFYIDTALLYTRLDTALRPMLLMSAALMPSLNEKVDLNKLPAPEIITKHLSPIVMSQNYETDGYMTESVGPVTMYHAVAGLALLGSGAMALYQHQTHGPGFSGWGKPTSSSASQPSLSPAASPSPSPAETP
jgi:hypothetical protein